MNSKRRLTIEDRRLTIEDISEEDNYNLKLSGIIDLNNSHELRAHYEIFRESNYSNLNIDFTNTSPKKDPGKQSLDTSVAATMVEFYCAISKKKGTLNIIMTKNQSKIIDLCILKTLFDGALTIVDKPTH